MTIILLKLFLCSFATMIFCSMIKLYEAGEYAGYFCGFILLCTMFFFIATICSFIWFF